VVDDELPPAIPAATVVLLRDGADGLETLMLRRNSKLAFAGGAWVFPGGRIDPEDYPDGAPSTDDGAVAAAARTAAVREAMEEAGLAVDPEGLVWFAHWTPGPLAARRFATWFFMTRAPEGAVTVDDGEIHEHRWIPPAEAMARRDAGEIELIPPTWMTLRLLSGQPSVEATLAAARARDPQIYVTHIARVDGGIASIWQGDAAYDDGDTSKPGPRNRLLMLEDGWRVEQSE
jgi:8-oxo-dGTP pyrophosphatase MutT (NUDIX family)